MSDPSNQQTIDLEAIANEALAMADYLKQRNLVLANEVVRMRRYIEAQQAEKEEQELDGAAVAAAEEAHEARKAEGK
ncbi:hypothetical protein C5748_17125 [Phyllobacterium phragmitis]|uniref:Uncharacterized protein n=1 Tax=Phyllobacterium phragmitis TaxID=2670329 RepID=A0A2S9INS9_9HYPH|nr:hypothetical protein [Phyllobacterium phragmitis]PRD42187.1 hypothetical protein C5748_17125 [Phyllobacterium phragmitis]